MSLKDKIAKVDDIKIVCYKVEEWGFEIYFKILSGAQRDDYENYIAKKQKGNGKNITLTDTKGLKSRLVAMCLCEETGELVYENLKEGMEELESKSAKVLNDLWDECADINGMAGDETEEIQGN